MWQLHQAALHCLQAPSQMTPSIPFLSSPTVRQYALAEGRLQQPSTLRPFAPMHQQLALALHDDQFALSNTGLTGWKVLHNNALGLT